MIKAAITFITAAGLAIITPFLTYGQSQSLHIVDKPRLQQRLVRTDTAQRMVALSTFIRHAKIRLPYATLDNFTGKQLYSNGDETYLRQPAAAALQQVAGHLERQGLGLLIWDAYRPHRASKQMWAMVPDERYVANPAKGSGHNRGIAVDLTLYELANGAELDMGTGFDHFSDSAHHSFNGLKPQQQQNRSILKKAMEDHGFKALDTEWWHYSWQGKTFPLLDLSFRQLARWAN